MSNQIHKNKIVIVGGTIAAGKSTLVKELSKILNGNFIFELRDNDKLQDIILRKLYEGDRIHIETIQYYFLVNRYEQYKCAKSMDKNVILDRSIGEDGMFAKLLMKNKRKSYKHYKKMGYLTSKKIIEKFGKPHVYIYLEIDGKTFKKRVFSRNRKTEIDNFEKNVKYFKRLLKEYKRNFKNILRKLDINIITIAASDLNKKQVVSRTIKKMKNYLTNK